MKKPKSKRPPPHKPDADGGEAFLPDVARSHTHFTDDDAESFAEEFIAEATSAEHIGEDARDDLTDEERIGSYTVDFTALDELDQLE